MLYKEKEFDWKKDFEDFENSRLVKEKSRKSTSLGWICPSCGKINAPWKGSCDCVVEWNKYPAWPWKYETEGPSTTTWITS